MFFGSGCAVHATRFSVSVTPVTAVSVIAVPGVVFQPFANSDGAPIVATRTAPRAVSIIATVSGNTASAVRRDA